jgi:hypothetical protein
MGPEFSPMTHRHMTISSIQRLSCFMPKSSLVFCFPSYLSHNPFAYFNWLICKHWIRDDVHYWAMGLRTFVHSPVTSHSCSWLVKYHCHRSCTVQTSETVLFIDSKVQYTRNILQGLSERRQLIWLTGSIAVIISSIVPLYYGLDGWGSIPGKGKQGEGRIMALEKTRFLSVHS